MKREEKKGDRVQMSPLLFLLSPVNVCGQEEGETWMEGARRERDERERDERKREKESSVLVKNYTTFVRKSEGESE